MKPNKNSGAAASRQSRAFKLKGLTVFTLFLLFNSVWAQNQQRKWFQNSKDVDFTVVPPTTAGTAGVNYESSGAQKATNGVHDHNNARIFNINGTELYAPYSSSSVYFSVFPSGIFEYLGAEVCIVPKPGSCDSFYIFYSHKHYHEGSGCDAYELSYHLVDRNLLIPPDPDFSLVESGQIFHKDLSVTCPPPAALAASKEKLLNGVRTRQLFYTEYDGTYYSIKRVDITYTGISAPATVYTHTNGLDLQTYELELSPDGSKLALGRSRFGFSPPEPHPDKDIVVYDLNANGTLGSGGVVYINIPTGSLTVESIAGLEFNSAGNRLFASRGNDAIYYIDNFMGTPAITAINSTVTKYLSFSQMEAVFNNGIEYIAVAKNENEVFRIENVSGTSPAISSSAFYSGTNTKVPRLVQNPVAYNAGGSVVSSEYLLSLPDQIDGDNYTAATGGWFDPLQSANCCVRFNTPHYTTEVVAVNGNNTPTSNQFGNINNVILKNNFRIPAGVVCTLPLVVGVSPTTNPAHKFPSLFSRRGAQRAGWFVFARSLSPFGGGKQNLR